MPSAAAKLDAADNRLVARERLLERLGKRLERGASLVLFGPPGVGKTRLAAEYLRAAGDPEALVLRLDDVRDVRAFLNQMARALDLLLPPTASDADAADRVSAALAARPPTVVALDPFEHLDADALLARWIGTTTLSWLVTSRRRLACPAEHIEVAPLSTRGRSARWSDAATLLRTRAEEIARVRLDEDDREAVEALAQQLDGSPLAIELAAARLAVLTPAQLRVRLERRFATLDGARQSGASDGESSQAGGSDGRALSGVLEASLTLLDDSARSALLACAVFRGGATLEALEAVLGDEVDVLGALTALRNQSLLRLERDAGAYRYALAHSVRDLVVMRERDSPAWDTVRDRHAEYWAAASPEDPRLAGERDNLLAAAAWTRGRQAKLCAHLALSASTPSLQLPYGAAHDLVSDALAQADELPDALRARLWFRRGTLRRFIGDFEGAAEDLDRAGAAAERLHDDALLAEVLAGRGNTRSGVADWAGARRDLERALAIHPAASFRPLGLAMIANTHSNEDAYDRAEPLLREAIGEADRLGEAFAGAFARLSLGILLVERSDFDEAHACLQEAATVLASEVAPGVMQGPHLQAVALTHLARVKQETGDTGGALTAYHEALTLADRAGIERALAFAHYGLASLLLELGELRGAGEHIHLALPLIRKSCRDVEGAVVALQGSLFALRGAHDDAERFFRRAAALLEAHARPVFSAALAVLRGGEPGEEFADYADVRLARRLRARFPQAQAPPPLWVTEDGSYFRLTDSGAAVSLARRKAVRGVLCALVDARLTTPGIPVSLTALIAAGWPGEKILPAAGAERVYAAIATLRRMGLRGLIQQEGGGYLLPPDRPVVRQPAG